MYKICHMTSAHRSDDTRIFHKECVSFSKAGYDTYLVAQGASLDHDGIHIIGIGAVLTSRLKRMTQTAKKVYKTALSLDADLYHLHDPELLPYGLKLKKRGKKVIFDSHENTLEQVAEKEWIPSIVRPLISIIYRSYAAHAFGKYDAIVSVTPHICQSLAQYNTLVRMVTNYPFLPLKTEEHQRKPGQIRLGFAGGISAQWSHAQILEALAGIPQAHYEVWGQGPLDYAAVLAQAVGYGQASFHGTIPHTEVAACLAALDAGLALCQYSQNTGGKLGTLGNTKIFEYMAVGLPIICTDFTLWQAIVNKYHCGICVNPNDVSAIAAAITYLMNHPEEARQMGENGRRAVEEEFNWATQEAVLLSIYKELLS